MRVFVTGGTGLVGGALARALLARGDGVDLLTRRPETARATWQGRVNVVAGDPMRPGPWQDAVAPCDAVVHLAGEGLFNRRWRAAFQQLLRDSRILSTNHVVAALAKQPRRADGAPKTLVSASAVGYYGPRGDDAIDESAGAGDDFLAQLCADWESAARAAEPLGVRVVRLRIGVVLARDGGALAKMLTPFKMFVGGPVGSGRQVMSWIHADDLVGQILFVLDHDKIHGPVNGTAPHPVTNQEFAKTLGRVLHRPSFLRTPGFMLRVALGQVAQVVTTGQRALPRAALDAGFPFRFADLDAALRNVLGR